MTTNNTLTEKIKRLEELRHQLSFVIYKQAGLYPHPHWEEEEKELKAEIVKLEKEINNG